ncbi:GH92 family glycosyl hydrolase [Micromonospora avicenniae]|uniref:Alpha-1,2-mannosidase, putative n=1 Tax=Micromonospora avicenniae TaxID=1198245 RepID=A0A1N6ZV23_9ACTN|nr:GH92 family glycosyl hydrolase [Micromonospora avicenniae]SIR30708.1 alpha-1,2-mannosidase, putative [Micromonospora avicenniae]
MSDPLARAAQTARRRTIAGIATAAVAVLATAAAGTPAAAAPAPHLVNDPVSYVNPLIGSTNLGNTYPGAVRPFGMLSWSPQTTRDSQVSTPAPGGYEYGATRIRGFSLTHLNGVGCNGGAGDIPIMPYVGDVDSSPTIDTSDAKYASNFSHANETARAGYYRVALDSGASAELTTTDRTGSGRFGFPADQPASMLFRTANSETGSTDATVQVDAEARTVTGSVTAGNFCGPQSPNNRKGTYTLHFTAHFDQPFARFGTWQDGTVTSGSSSASGGTGVTSGFPTAGKGSGAYVTFADGTTQVGVKVAVSYVSLDNAEANLRAENPQEKTFDTVRAEATKAWQRELSKIKVGGGTADQLSSFYTALYHSMLEPTIASDVDGRYLGADGKPHQLAKGQKMQYGTFSGWDQYRAQVQLMTLINPKAGSDYAQSLFNYASQRDGEWDRWLLINGKTAVMSGDPSAPALAGIYAFGGRDFDVKGALRSLITAATVPTANDSDSAGCNVACVGQRPALDKYLELGYVPADGCSCWGGAAETLEDAVADFGLAELAGRLGDHANQQAFLDRSGNWSNVFDLTATPQGGYLRARKADGAWAEQSFNPATENGFVEGSSARYTWMVYSDVAGLARAMGGNKAAEQRLDAFFRTPDGSFDFSARDHTRFDPTNEPDMNAPYVYNYLGVPHKTQETVRAVLNQLWGNTPGGIPGNDDAGTMSSWYVFSALGLYPQNPSRADLVLSAPLFTRAVINSGPGRDITINAPDASAKNMYIQSVRVDGKKSTKTWVPASLVEKGGKLDFALGSKPNLSWGTSPADAPPSFGHGRPYLAGVSPQAMKVEPGGKADTTYKVQALTGDPTKVRWHVTAPAGLNVTPADGEVALSGDGSATRALTVSPDAGMKPGAYSISVTATTASGEALPAVTLPITVAARDSVLWNLNSNGISADDTNPQANFDTGGWSYSATALEAAGVRPGSTVSVNGFDFTWPNVAPGDPDNIVVGGGGQVVSVTPAEGDTKLSVLGSAAFQATSGTVTLTYTDGTTQQAEIGFSDWTLGGGSQQPSFGNLTAVRTAYRDYMGSGIDPVTTYVFATAPIELLPGKQLASLTLPSNTNGGVMHVFGVATA